MVSLTVLLVMLLMVGTTLWMAIDAKTQRIAVDKKIYSLNNGALAWFLTGILLWIFTFPYYLWKRSVVMDARRQAQNPRPAPPIASPHGDGREL